MSDYFETMGIPIVQGRSFQPADAASTGMVAIVNETLVNTFWKGRNPIGLRLRPCCGDQVPWFTVVGVAKDVKQGGVDQKTGTEFYFFIDQTSRVPSPLAISPATMNVVLRTTLPPDALAQTIERVVRDTDRTVPIVRLRDMDTVFAESIRRPRLLAHLLGAFAGLALLLAAIGTYGVLTYMVAERRREIGIRMSLGADRSSVLAQIMKQGLVLTGSRRRRGACRRARAEPADRVAAVRRAADRCDDPGRGDGDDCARGRDRLRRCLPGGPRASTRTWCFETIRASRSNENDDTRRAATARSTFRFTLSLVV